MKNLLSFLICGCVILTGGLACQNNPLSKFTKQYNCSVPNEPEPVTAEDFIKRAYKHIELDNYSDAFNQCAFDAAQEAVRLDPQNAAALSVRGKLYVQKKDFDSALADLNEAIRLDPRDLQAFRFRSLVFEQKNMPDKAIEDLSVILGTEESHFDYARRGGLYLKKNEPEKALQDYSQAIRMKPGEESYYLRRAEIYRKLGRNSEADADESQAKGFEEEHIPDANVPPLPSTPDKPMPKTISGGVLNGKATNLVKPTYPAAAKAVQASGAVNVQVTIDEQGNVISANAVSGHPLLRASAVQAARASKFSPTLLSGKPVKVTGVIVYNYVSE